MEYIFLAMAFDISVRLQLNHPLICGITSVSLHGSGGSHGEVQMKFMPYGSLATIIDRVSSNDVPDYWTATNIAKVILTIVLSLDKLHSEQIPHGNVQLRSFLIDEHFWACLRNFLPDGVEGSAFYQAGEVVDPWMKTAQADSFAVGIVLYEVITGRRAFTGDPRAARGEILAGQMPSLGEVPSECMGDVIRNCWNPAPANRSTMRMILRRFERCNFEILPDVDAEKVREEYAFLSALPISHQ
jgi:serine/threonine protein kinase